jgi:putative SOS response-associated peptidase YedK
VRSQACVTHLLGSKKLPGGKRKQPYYLERRDGEPIALAGLWEEWRGPDRKGEPLRTVTIITTTPSATMAPVHDRMPVILPPSAWDAWLDPTNDDTEASPNCSRPPQPSSSSPTRSPRP